MRPNLSRLISFFIAVISCILLSGCKNNEKNDSAESMKNESEIVSVSIHETGGEDGRNIEWKIYSQNDIHYLSYSDNNKTYGEPTQGVFEITEQEYETIMCLDYQKYIEDYDESFWKNVADAIYFQSIITYRNGDEKSTNAIMTDATIKLRELLQKYKEQPISVDSDLS